MVTNIVSQGSPLPFLFRTGTGEAEGEVRRGAEGRELGRQEAAASSLAVCLPAEAGLGP